MHTFNRHTANQNDFSKIPGSPIAYWVSDRVKEIFEKSQKLGDIAEPRQGMATSDNNRFLRLWQEVSRHKIGLGFNDREEAKKSGMKWFPYNKGGEFQKWYGNQEYLVNWENDGVEIQNFYDENGKLRSRPQNLGSMFKEGITWSFVSSSNFGVRYTPKGFLFDVGGSSAFPETDNILYITAFLTSKITFDMLKIVAPTINFQVGDIKSLPVVFPDAIDTKKQIEILTQQCIDVSREEWDSRETSWHFKQNELIRHKTDDGKIASAYKAYSDYWREKFHQLHANEEKLNRLFIDIYGLSDELTPDVALEDITILKSESRIENGELIFNADEIARQFISYAVGCMFGRYALDREGLVVANMDQEIPKELDSRLHGNDERYFAIDDDNIIPVLEEEVFADDIAARFERFVGVAFGEERVGENLRWIEEALGMNIRKYFYGEFYKDHVRRYKKRPIYWLIQSPKKGFQALIYMHRYQSDTMARVQTMYLREYLTKLESLIEHYNTIASNPSSSAKDAKDAAKLSSKLEGKHRDALDFDRGDMSRIAAEQISIDLDDGVKVNYQKFKGVLPDIGLSKGED